MNSVFLHRLVTFEFSIVYIVKVKNKKNWFGILFGLVFLISGISVSFVTGGKLIGDYLSSSDWVKVPATIHHAKLIFRSGETKPFSLSARYSYQHHGKSYTNDRVSLSSDNDGASSAYWKDLNASIKYNQSINESTAFVNPDNPKESVLDRTFQWKTLISQLVLLITFCGIGGGAIWLSIRPETPRHERVQKEQAHGISSDQKYGYWFFGGFGSIVFVIGTVAAISAIPDALQKGDYGALATLIFVVAGALIIAQAIKMYLSYRKFGGTPLFLNPETPSVGGQLGGTFEVIQRSGNHGFVPNGKLPTGQANLRCTKKTRSRKNTHQSLLWQTDTEVFLQRSSGGYQASFIFDIPKDCEPSSRLSRRSTIHWQVEVNSDLGPTLGKLHRSWQIDVLEEASQNKSTLAIPTAFQLSSAEASLDKAQTSALSQISLTEGDQYIGLKSAGRQNLASHFFGIVFGGIFSAVGVFTIFQGWLGGYLFLLIGALVALMSIYLLGKVIDVRIDKHSAVLNARESWMGMVYSRKTIDISDVSNFQIKKTSTTKMGNTYIEYYALKFKTDSKPIHIAHGIKGKKEAKVLREIIISALVDDSAQAA